MRSKIAGRIRRKRQLSASCSWVINQGWWWRMVSQYRVAWVNRHFTCLPTLHTLWAGPLRYPLNLGVCIATRQHPSSLDSSGGCPSRIHVKNQTYLLLNWQVLKGPYMLPCTCHILIDRQTSTGSGSMHIQDSHCMLTPHGSWAIRNGRKPVLLGDRLPGFLFPSPVRCIMYRWRIGTYLGRTKQKIVLPLGGSRLFRVTHPYRQG